MQAVFSLIDDHRLRPIEHPRSPLVPTVHANFRFLTHGSKAWFGGGADLTPYYPFREDVIHFHQVWHQVCTRHPVPVDYERFKKWCDDYFFLTHRNEGQEYVGEEPADRGTAYLVRRTG